MDSNKVYIGCCLVILNPTKDKVLIAKRKKEPDINGWQIPGGTVDYDNGENMEDAVIREASEETGITIKNPEFLSIMNTFYYGKERPIHVAFVAQADGEEIPPNPEPHKAEDWHWVGLDNLPDGKWFRMSKEAIRIYNDRDNQPQRNNFVIDAEYKNFI
jgi:ADP-ribose pyrophosphatase YjhB (NUDIX family)